MSRLPLARAALLASAVWMLPATAAEHPKAIQSLEQRGVEVVKTFPAPAGMTGYVVMVRGQADIVYLTADKKHVLAGVMLDESGENLTSAQLRRHGPQPDLSSAWEKAEQSTWVADGAAEPKSIVYALADPYCPYCHAFWKASQAYHSAGLQVRWIPVAYLHPDSSATAAAILQADDPSSALREHEEKFEKGGIGPLLEPDPEVVEAVERNTRLMQEIGARGTPAVLYKDAEGKARLVQGMPPLGKLPEIFALPEQKLDDPDLQRFR